MKRTILILALALFVVGGAGTVLAQQGGIRLPVTVHVTWEIVDARDHTVIVPRSTHPITVTSRMVPMTPTVDLIERAAIREFPAAHFGNNSFRRTGNGPLQRNQGGVRQQLNILGVQIVR